MLSNHEIADMNYCRRCINQKYRIHLKRSDVVVLQMMYPCARCGEMKHPVHAVKWTPGGSCCLPTPAGGKNHKKRKSAVREHPHGTFVCQKTPKDCRGGHGSPLQCTFGV